MTINNSAVRALQPDGGYGRFYSGNGSKTQRAGAGTQGAGAGATPGSNVFQTPATVFPQYSSGSWAGLPTGMIGAQQSQQPAGGANASKTYYPVNPLGPYSGPLGTAPTAPSASPTPASQSGIGGLFGGLFDGLNNPNFNHDPLAFLRSLGLIR
jgi:hypothetical protein